ncbi:MAG: beta-propeller fold lactonase family protein, partial [Flavitalea sp.]
ALTGAALIRPVVVTDLGLDQISIYDFDPSGSKPLNEQARTVNTNQGAGPRHIIFHKKLPFAYTIEELSGYVSVYSYKSGMLEPLQTLNAHPADFKGEIGSAAIRISPDGKFVYASNRGASNTIAIFAIDQQTGKLISKGFQKTLGENPRDFNIDPTGNFLLVANEKTGNVVVFKRDKKTGLLKATGKTINIPEPVNLVFLY